MTDASVADVVLVPSVRRSNSSKSNDTSSSKSVLFGERSFALYLLRCYSNREKKNIHTDPSLWVANGVCVIG